MFWKNIFKSKKLPISKTDYDVYFSGESHTDVELSVLHLGELVVTSGRIIACDPLVCLGETRPFTQSISSGKYPVKIVIANSTSMGKRYALARLEVTPNKAVRWELAITDDMVNKTHELKANDYFGFPVDAGLACFCDMEAQQSYVIFRDKFLSEHPDANMYDDYFAERFKMNAEHVDDPMDVGDWLNYSVPGTTGNVIMFHSGFGDGIYPSYWGFDRDNRVTALIIDFQVIGQE